MPSPFPGMDPYLEKGGIFHELHVQMLAEAQGLLQPQVRPKYVARLERHLPQFHKQRRIVIYVNERPRLVVAAVELLSPSNKDPKSIGQALYLEKRASALHGGVHWIEIDLLRGGQRPPIQATLPYKVDYLGYVVQATPTGREHHAYGWNVRDAFPQIPIPLVGNDVAVLDLAVCFQRAYDRIGADDEADYAADPPPPALSDDDRRWVEALLKEKGLR